MEQKQNVEAVRQMIKETVEQAERLYGVSLLRVRVNRDETTGEVRGVDLHYEIEIKDE